MPGVGVESDGFTSTSSSFNGSCSNQWFLSGLPISTFLLYMDYPSCTLWQLMDGAQRQLEETATRNRVVSYDLCFDIFLLTQHWMLIPGVLLGAPDSR